MISWLSYQVYTFMIQFNSFYLIYTKENNDEKR